MALAPRKAQLTLVVFLLASVLGAGAAGAQVCGPLPSGEVGWWPGEGNTIDAITGNAGTLDPGELRVWFHLDDNDDTGNDYLGYYSGEATSTYRPQLVVTYQ